MRENHPLHTHALWTHPQYVPLLFRYNLEIMLGKYRLESKIIFPISGWPSNVICPVVKTSKSDRQPRLTEELHCIVYRFLCVLGGSGRDRISTFGVNKCVFVTERRPFETWIFFGGV